MKKIIAIVISLTMIFSMSGVAFADTAAAPQKTSVAVDKTGVKSDILDVMEVFPVKTMETSASTAPEFITWELTPDTYGIAELVAPVSGIMTFDYEMEGAVSTDRVDIIILENYNDAEGNQLGRLCPGEAFYDDMPSYLEKGEKYYICFSAPDYNTGTVTVSSRAKMYSSASDRTLPAYTNTGKYMWASPLDYSKASGFSDIYYKVVPAKTGLMTVNLKAYGETVGGVSTTQAKVTLYNANRKALSNTVQYNSSKEATKAYFGVTKGKTYYIRVQNCYDTEGYIAPKYGIRYGLTAATDRNIATNAKALQLKKGAAATKTMITANNTTGTDVYKINVTKSQKTTFTVNTQKIRSGNLTIKVFRNGKQVGKTQTLYPNNTSGKYTITYGTVSGKASKGTYHIKVTKGAKASGLYTIKYNN